VRPPTGEEIQAELDVLRAELAEARLTQERVREREARLRKERDRAQRVARVLSHALAERLQQETVVELTRRPRWGRSSNAVTPQEAAQLEQLRHSPLFDAPWYLRNHPDVARRGEDPALHFLRHWHHPIRRPSEKFDIAQYVLDHPEVVTERINPLLHFLDSAQSDGADSYPPTAP
jgi:hypothetical protein